MAPTVLVKDLLWRTSVQLGDTSPQFQRFSEREMVMALNDGQACIAKYVPTCGSRVDAFKLAPGSRQSIAAVDPANLKTGDGATLTTMQRGLNLITVNSNMGSDGLTRGSAINLADRRLLDAFRPTWALATGTEVQEFVYDPLTPTFFWINPGLKAGVTAWVELAWNVLPAEVSVSSSLVNSDGVHLSGVYGFNQSSSVTIGIGDQWADDLMNYMLMRLWFKDGKYREPAKAQAAGSLFINSINAQVKAITGQDPNVKLASLMGVSS